MSTNIKEIVQEKYGQAAVRASEGKANGCCGASASCGPESWDPITADLYDEQQRAGVPAEAILASLGCGNPTALANLHQGRRTGST